MSKSVVLLSGGMDSAVVALLEQEAGREVWPLQFYYKQRHWERETCAAHELCRRFGWVQRKKILLLPELGGSSLTSDGELSGPPVVVPGRNAIFCWLAANYAVSIGAERVVLGCCANDQTLFPDCRPETFATRNTDLFLCGLPVRIETPLAEMTKAQIVAEGNRLGVPWELTWSCYAGAPEPCGQCGACIERNKVLP